MEKESIQTIVIFLNEDSFLSKLAEFNFVESISVVDSIQTVYFSHILAINPRYSREDESAVRRKRGSSRKDRSWDTTRRSLSLCVSPRDSIIILYYMHTQTRARAKGTKLDLQTKLDPRRLSPFFPRTRRVAEPTPVVLNIRLSRALIM